MFPNKGGATWKSLNNRGEAQLYPSVTQYSWVDSETYLTQGASGAGRLPRKANPFPDASSPNNI